MRGKGPPPGQNRPHPPAATDLTLAECLMPWPKPGPVRPSPSARVSMRAICWPMPGPLSRSAKWMEPGVRDYTHHLLNQPVMIWYGARAARDPPGARQCALLEPCQEWPDAHPAHRQYPVPVTARYSSGRTICAIPLTRLRVLDEMPKVKDLPEQKCKAGPTPEPVQES